MWALARLRYKLREEFKQLAEVATSQLPDLRHEQLVHVLAAFTTCDLLSHPMAGEVLDTACALEKSTA